jgi:predicted transglutaminase-like cysteine proteinase
MGSYSVAQRINSDVNSQVQYKSDLENYSKPEFWVEAGTFGDCEDYALRKRQVLLNSGFARKDLHLACCWVETTEGYHCILLCNTDQGWFVLDNRYAWPMPPKLLPYTWDKALDEVDGKWYKLSF